MGLLVIGLASPQWARAEEPARINSPSAQRGHPVPAAGAGGRG